MGNAVPDEVVLFEGSDGVERLRVVCRRSGADGLVLVQESAGEVSRWCFGESPHRAILHIDAQQVHALARHFRVRDAGGVAAALEIEVAGFESLTQTRRLLTLGGADDFLDRPRRPSRGAPCAPLSYRTRSRRPRRTP